MLQARDVSSCSSANTDEDRDKVDVAAAVGMVEVIKLESTCTMLSAAWCKRVRGDVHVACKYDDHVGSLGRCWDVQCNGKPDNAVRWE